MEERLKLEVASGDALDVREFSITEGLSTLFEVNLIALSETYDIDLEEIVGKPATFRIKSGVAHVSKGERAWSGVCSRIEEVHTEKGIAGSKSLSTYRVRILPTFWLLTQSYNRRIFQRKTIPEIVTEVLASRGVTPKPDLIGKYKQLDYVVQYDETDYVFVTRLLERAGITFFFKFEGKTELVLSDHPQDIGPRPPIRYTHNPSLEAERECVGVVKIAQRVRPGTLTIRDFDFRRKLDYPLFGDSKPAKAPEDFYERYHYEPGASLVIDPDGPDDGAQQADDKGKVRSVEPFASEIADQRLASERRQRRRVAFETNCLDLAPGVAFAMQEHPRDDLSGKLLVTDLAIEGEVNGAWTERGEAVLASQPYRPVMKTARPRVSGVETAVVVGPDKEQIHTDEYGRVRVKFPWDRSKLTGDQTSCWIRVSQAWAGSGYGSILIPRIGQEVLVSFLEGDPDQPVIIGRVYNAREAIPAELELPRYDTRSTWMSDTSKHEDNAFNEIRFEDANDKQFIFLQAQKDHQKLVKRNETERTSQNRAILVGKSRSAIIAAVDTTLVGEKYSLQMMKKPTPDELKILKMEKPTVTPLPTKVEMVDQKILCTSGKATAVLKERNITFEAKQHITFWAKGGKIVVQGGPRIKINS